MNDCPDCKDPQTFYSKKRHRQHELKRKLEEFHDKFRNTKLKKVYGEDRWVRE